MALNAKYEYKHSDILRDARPWAVRFADSAKDPLNAAIGFAMAAMAIYIDPIVGLFADVIFLIFSIYFFWLVTRPTSLPFKMPKSARRVDPHANLATGKPGMADGIFYLGNSADSGEEIWFTNNDTRTHMLYLGTTGSGKTVGLKGISTNALCWGSGYIYIDGKADTDLWSTLSALARRFGRDDDILLMNYMTGNVGGRVPSNTLNPFSSGSASYLTNMLVSLMPDSEGDNAMWKDRAVALVSAIMPCLVWKRDNQNIPLSIGVVRTYLTFKAVIKLSRDKAVPEHLRGALRGYLNELPGYVDNVFDDEGNEKPAGPDSGAVDTSTPRQQHGYLSMQFTRSMSSLGDDYGFIFDTQAADVDMLDVVLNRRILIVLIPALEKSGDETANLGKIISSSLKGMMGATLGSTVEGDTATAIDNKATRSSTPFIAIFDEVGYYAAAGMAVMAAQARSLGFSLIFAAQDMPALEKRVKEEARSITANCNIKIFGKLEDPTQTKEFFEKTVGQAIVTEVSGFERGKDGGKNYSGSANASVQVRARASYDGLKAFNEGKAICAFGKNISEMQVYFADVGHAKAMRVHRFLPIPPPSEEALESLHQIDAILRRFRDPKWNPQHTVTPANVDIAAMARGFAAARKAGASLIEYGIVAVASVAEAHDAIKAEDFPDEEAATPASSAEARMIPSGEEISPEKAAAAAVAKVAGGPLSWTELLSADAAKAPEADSGREESGVKEESAPLPEAPQEFSLENILGSAGTTPSPQTSPAASSPPMPFNWGDIIGVTTTGSEALDTTALSEPSPPAEEPAPLAQEEEPPRKPAFTAFTWADIIGAGEDTDKKE